MAVNHLDRSMMFLLLQPIKMDLNLTDTQLGMLTGIASGLLFSVLGVPFARWADCGNRVRIIVFSMMTWSATALALFFVGNFVQLMFVRVIAGVGDAGVHPPAYSLLGDYFPDAVERTRALYFLYMGGPLISMACFMTGGWVNDRMGWRWAFLLSSLIGLVCVALAKWTLKEPRVDGNAKSPEATGPVPPFSAIMSLMWNRLSCRHIAIVYVLLFTVGHGAISWQAAYLMRRHDMSTTELGIWMGLIIGIAGISSMLLGQYIITRWFTGKEREQMQLAAWSTMLTTGIFAAFLMLPNKGHALIALTLQTFVFAAFQTLPAVLLQRLVPAAMRSTMLTMMLLFANLIGYGVGPLLVGAVSDALSARMGQTDGLRYAMMLMSVGWVWAGYHFLKVGQFVRKDLVAADSA